MNDSSTGGYLLPAATPAPLEDDDLDDFIQAFVVGITGLGGQFVRPRWQEEPPNLPPLGVNWAAVGIATREGDTYSVERHVPAGPGGQGADLIVRHETLEILSSFYGPQAQANGALLRDGLGVAQNREILTLNNMGLISIGQLIRGPELIKNRWISKIDLPFAIRRMILRVYPVLNLESASITVTTDSGVTVHSTPIVP